MASRAAWDKDLTLERALVQKLTDFRVRSLNHTQHRAFTYTEIGHQIGQHPSSLYNWERQVCFPGTFAAWKSWAAALGLELRIELVPAPKKKSRQ